MSRKLIPSIAVAVGLAVAAAGPVGCSNQTKVSEARREEQRRAMQLEDLTNQRNVLKAELDRAKQANGEMQKNLSAAQQQLEQARAEANRARAELQAATAAGNQAQAQAQQAELAALKQQLQALQDRLSAATPSAGGETRTVTPAAPATPATQPSGAGANK